MKPHYLIIIVWLWATKGVIADPAPGQPNILSSFSQPLKDGLEAYRLGQFRRAYILLEPFARKGEAQAQFTLAMMYSGGYGVELDETIAAHWFELAAAQGHRDSQYFLAQLYEQGWGIVSSKDNAIHWYQRCAEQSDSRCRMRLERANSNSQNSVKESIMVTEPATAITSTLPSLLPVPEKENPNPLMTTIEFSHSNSTPTPKIAPASSSIDSVESTTLIANGNLLGEDWIRAQKPTNYTLQIFTSLAKQDLHNYAYQHALKGELAIMPELRRGQTWYNLIYGSYATNSVANKARSSLPPEIIKSGIWIRQFGKLRIPPMLPVQDKPAQSIPSP
ncbi:conserved hypothetical protein [Gammaproteobacteria bacterium]